MKEILNGDVECFYGCGSLRDGLPRCAAGDPLLVGGAALIAIGTGVGLAAGLRELQGRWADG